MERDAKTFESNNNIAVKDIDIKDISFKITHADIEELSEKISSSKTIKEKIDAILIFNEEKIKSINISGAEKEIKNLLNRGFIIKNDNEFLNKTYTFIDKNVNESIKNICLKEPICEIQGIKFREATKYGRDTTIKNILISKDKLKEINLKKLSYNFNLNKEFKLSELTLKNYFYLKENNIDIDLDRTFPGTITIKSNLSKYISDTNSIESNHNELKTGEQYFDNCSSNTTNSLEPFKTINYDFYEKPSTYLWKHGYEGADIENELLDRFNNSKEPLLGLLNTHKNYIDGFSNIKVLVNNKKILELESHYNWDKVRDYIKYRDLDVETKGSPQHKLSEIQVHHINQLQDGGSDNIRNYIALHENSHKVIDSCDNAIDKRISEYKELLYPGSHIDENEIINEKELRNLVKSIGELPLNDKIILNNLKSEIESRSAYRLTTLICNKESLKLKFIDYKTKEDFRLLVIKNLDSEENIIVNGAVKNFVNELTSSIS